MWRTALALLAVAAAVAPAPAGAAGGTEWVSTEQTQVRLVSAATATGYDGEVHVGLHVRLEPGWKIYWRHPGDAGIPPSFDWEASGNLAEARVAWPAPHRFTASGLTSIGYTDEVLLPVAVRPERRGEPLSLVLRLNYGVCREICIPYDAELRLQVPAGRAAPTPFAPLVARFQALVPPREPVAGLAMEAPRLLREAPGTLLEVVARAERAFHAPDLLVEGPEGWSAGVPKVTLDEAGRLARFRVPLARSGAAPLPDGATVVLTLLDGERAGEFARRLR